MNLTSRGLWMSVALLAALAITGTALAQYRFVGGDDAAYRGRVVVSARSIRPTRHTSWV
jgi:hypothetical protein